MIVSIFEDPGPNFVEKAVGDWLSGRTSAPSRDSSEDTESISSSTDDDPVSLQLFLDFAIGAVECLEMLHGQQIVHGEVRADAFHMNIHTGQVRLLNLGAGLRTFENGLTTTGWVLITKDIGAATKLSYMSPEQTGRMPNHPDSRTDIYSLGVLFWTMLTHQPVFGGDTLMEIIREVLGKQLPLVSTVRLDIPDVISRIIQKATAKNIDGRYHSASGLKHDLVEVRKLLGAGECEALEDIQLASKDISSAFILPAVMMGREKEHQTIIKVLAKVHRRHRIRSKRDMYKQSGPVWGSMGSTNEKMTGPISSPTTKDSMTAGSETQSAREKTDVVFSSPELGPAHLASDTEIPSTIQLAAHSQRYSIERRFSTPSTPSLNSKDRSMASIVNSSGSPSKVNLDGNPARINTETMSSLTGSRKANHRYFRRGRCEVIGITASAGLGKSFLIRSVQTEARRKGCFASCKFDSASQTPFDPLLRLLSSLFKQVFSESDQVDPAFHQALRRYLGPTWPIIHKILDLPEFLLSSGTGTSTAIQSLRTSQDSRMNTKSNTQPSELSSISSRSSSSIFGGAQTSQDFLLGGSGTKSNRLMSTYMEILRVFTDHRFLCFCLDDLHFADVESLDLITQIISARMDIVVILAYRPEEMSSQNLDRIVELFDSDENGWSSIYYR